MSLTDTLGRRNKADDVTDVILADVERRAAKLGLGFSAVNRVQAALDLRTAIRLAVLAVTDQH
jgi:hypothetical protein